MTGSSIRWKGAVKRGAFHHAGLVLVAVLLGLVAMQVPEARCSVVPSAERVSESLVLEERERSFLDRAAVVARDINLMTGLAISPALTVSCVGAYSYLTTPPERRGELTVFAHPVVWMTLWGLLAAVFFKDLLFGIVPSAGVRQLVNGAEALLRSPASAVACVAYLPVFLRSLEELMRAGGIGVEVVSWAVVPVLGMIDPWAVLQWLVVGVIALGTMFALGVYTVLSAAISLVAALMPFGILVWAIKLARAAALGVLMVLSAMSPFLGLALVILGVWIALALAQRLMGWVKGSWGKWRTSVTVNGKVWSRSPANGSVVGRGMRSSGKVHDADVTVLPPDAPPTGGALR